MTRRIKRTEILAQKDIRSLASEPAEIDSLSQYVVKTPIFGSLVGGLKHEFDCTIQLGMSSSQLTDSYFSEARLNHQ